MRDEERKGECKQVLHIIMPSLFISQNKRRRGKEPRMPTGRLNNEDFAVQRSQKKKSKSSCR